MWKKALMKKRVAEQKKRDQEMKKKVRKCTIKQFTPIILFTSCHSTYKLVKIMYKDCYTCTRKL